MHQSLIQNQSKEPFHVPGKQGDSTLHTVTVTCPPEWLPTFIHQEFVPLDALDWLQSLLNDSHETYTSKQFLEKWLVAASTGLSDQYLNTSILSLHPTDLNISLLCMEHPNFTQWLVLAWAQDFPTLVLACQTWNQFPTEWLTQTVSSQNSALVESVETTPAATPCLNLGAWLQSAFPCHANVIQGTAPPASTVLFPLTPNLQQGTVPPV